MIQQLQSEVKHLLGRQTVAMGTSASSQVEPRGDYDRQQTEKLLRKSERRVQKLVAERDHLTAVCNRLRAAANDRRNTEDDRVGGATTGGHRRVRGNIGPGGDNCRDGDVIDTRGNPWYGVKIGSNVDKPPKGSMVPAPLIPLTANIDGLIAEKFVQLEKLQNQITKRV